MFSVKFNLSNSLTVNDINNIFLAVADDFENHRVITSGDVISAYPIKKGISLYYNSFRLSVELRFCDTGNGSQLIGEFALEKSVKRMVYFMLGLLVAFALIAFIKVPEQFFGVLPIFGFMAVSIVALVYLGLVVSSLFYRNKIMSILKNIEKNHEI